MTDTEINEAIARECGWKLQDHPDTKAATSGFSRPQHWVTHPSGGLCGASSIPDYCHNLNAMHEAEKTFPDENTKREYVAQLVCLMQSGEFTVMAPPLKRAEAFLRTKGLWRE